MTEIAQDNTHGISRDCKSRGILALAIILVVLAIDQLTKIYIKTHFYWGEDVEVLPFFHLRFVQNPGMAFGMELGSKLFLTLFRIVAVAILGWVIWRIRRNPVYPVGVVVCIALITAGAAGNIVDCVCYGEIFTNPAPPEVAQFVPWGEGYGSVLHGMVVDMLYFPLFSFDWPSWMPLVGGTHFTFFDPVFNIADSAITVGMLVMIIWYSKYLNISSSKNDGNDRDVKSEQKGK